MTHPTWVLTERTNLNRPYAEELEEGQIAMRSWVFDSFEKAKTEMRQLIKYHASTQSDLFDGKGYIHSWDEYINDQLADDDGEQFKSIPFLHENYVAFVRCAAVLRETLPSFLMGQDVTFTDDDWTNHMVEWEIQTDEQGETVFFFADTETDTIPSLFMNCIVMKDPEKSYCCRVRSNDEWELGDAPFVNIDLVCCEMNETPKEEFEKNAQ